MTREILKGTLGTFAFKNGIKIVLIQYPPQKRTIITGGGLYHLYFPYTTFVIEYLLKEEMYKFIRLNVGFSDIYIKNIDDPLHRLPLGNYSPPMVVCCSEISGSSFKTEKEMAQFVIDYFWQSVFSSQEGMADWHELTILNKPVNSLYSKAYSIRYMFKCFGRNFDFTM